MIYRHLDRRVTGHKVPAKNVSLCPLGNGNPIDIAQYRVLLNRVVLVLGVNEPDAEVVPLGYVTISYQPVLTDPVALCAK